MIRAYVNEDGGLYRYDDAEYLRQADHAEAAASKAAAKRDGGAGVILVADTHGEAE